MDCYCMVNGQRYIPYVAGNKYRFVYYAPKTITFKLYKGSTSTAVGSGVSVVVNGTATTTNSASAVARSEEFGTSAGYSFRMANYHGYTSAYFDSNKTVNVVLANIAETTWQQTTAGTYTFTVPANITKLRVAVVGGGGSGAGNDCSCGGCD